MVDSRRLADLALPKPILVFYGFLIVPAGVVWPWN